MAAVRCAHAAAIPAGGIRPQRRNAVVLLPLAADPQLSGQAFAYLYFESEAQRRPSTEKLTRDEAFLIAVNIAKLPSAPRQTLKDIPRPPELGQPRRLRPRKISLPKINIPVLYCYPLCPTQRICAAAPTYRLIFRFPARTFPVP